MAEFALGSSKDRANPEFHADDGVRIGMQTMYMDEALRITRCTTRTLAGPVTSLGRHIAAQGAKLPI